MTNVDREAAGSPAARLDRAIDAARGLCAAGSEADVRRELLRALARELRAWVYVVGPDGRCRGPVGGGRGIERASDAPYAALTVGRAVREAVDGVRGSRGRAVVAGPAGARAQLGGAQVLLGRLDGARASDLGHEPAVVDVVIAVRAARFSSAERLAAEILLLSGGATLRAAALADRQRETTLEMVWTLANAIDARDHRTAGHSQRVARLARLTGEALGLEEPALQALEWAGALHDVGKLGISDRILNKPGPLTDVERAQAQMHPQLGSELLRPLRSLRSIREAILRHHENHDGSGYPDGLAGEAIPLLARILHVVDIFDALVSDRPYRRGMTADEAIGELRRGAGTVTDPHVTRAFIEAFGALRTTAAGATTGVVGSVARTPTTGVVGSDGGSTSADPNPARECGAAGTTTGVVGSAAGATTGVLGCVRGGSSVDEVLSHADATDEWLERCGTGRNDARRAR